MTKREWYQVDISGHRGSTTINRSLSQLAETKGEASRLAKERYKRMHPDAKNIEIKKNEKWK